MDLISLINWPTNKTKLNSQRILYNISIYRARASPSQVKVAQYTRYFKYRYISCVQFGDARGLSTKIVSDT